MTFEGAIGIDLGTTYSCLAVFLSDRAEVIANDQGNRTTPSVVAFHNDEVLVGDAAKNLAARGASGVVYDAKRMIGRRFSDAVLQSDRARWPFVVVEGAHDAVEVAVPFRGTTHRFTPEQISAYVLLYLKECAERFLGKRVRDVVITVPAYFGDAQRERTRAAASIAELRVVRMVNEPTAAALCYGLGMGGGRAARAHETTSAASPPAAAAAAAAVAMQNVVVFDFGGGTFDVSVITIDGSSFAVRATAGDTHLGGQDIDDNLVRYVLDDLRARFGVDVATSHAVTTSGDGGSGGGGAATGTRQLAKVRAACERAKRVLSHATSEELVVDGVLPDGAEYTLTLSRAKFDELNADVYARCMAVVDAALRDAGMTAEEADVVILVGGSSRIARVQELLRTRFRDGVVRNSVHPDEAVAMGAAVQASVLSDAAEQRSARTSEVVLIDVVPLSIGVEVDDGRCDVLIPRNTAIPYRVTKEYTTVEDNQRDVDIVVYEGEHKRTKHNRRLGEFALEGITRARKGDPTITVTFSINADGLLTVTASEALAQATKTLTVQNVERLSEDEVQRLGAHVRGLRARNGETNNRMTKSSPAAATATTATMTTSAGADGATAAAAAAPPPPPPRKSRRNERGTDVDTATTSVSRSRHGSKKNAAAPAAVDEAATATRAAKEDDTDDGGRRTRAETAAALAGGTDNNNDDDDDNDEARLSAATATLEAAMAGDGADVPPHVRRACEQLLSYTHEWRRRKLPKYTDAREREAKVAKMLARLERATRHARKRTRRDDGGSGNESNHSGSNAASDGDDADDADDDAAASHARRARVDTSPHTAATLAASNNRASNSNDNDNSNHVVSSSSSNTNESSSNNGNTAMAVVKAEDTQQ